MDGTMRQDDAAVAPAACQRMRDGLEQRRDSDHAEVMRLLNIISKEQADVRNRLYKDNGNKSIQSRLNESDVILDEVIKNQGRMDGALTRLFWAIATPIIAGSLYGMIILIKHVVILVLAKP